MPQSFRVFNFMLQNACAKKQNKKTTTTTKKKNTKAVTEAVPFQKVNF